jgi:hypothetical protein
MHMYGIEGRMRMRYFARWIIACRWIFDKYIYIYIYIYIGGTRKIWLRKKKSAWM